jgi:hypothetical protein
MRRRPWGGHRLCGLAIDSGGRAVVSLGSANVATGVAQCGSHHGTRTSPSGSGGTTTRTELLVDVLTPARRLTREKTWADKADRRLGRSKSGYSITYVLASGASSSAARARHKSAAQASSDPCQRAPGRSARWPWLMSLDDAVGQGAALTRGCSPPTGQSAGSNGYQSSVARAVARVVLALELVFGLIFLHGQAPRGVFAARFRPALRARFDHGL